jgi:hypothetical protein
MSPDRARAGSQEMIRVGAMGVRFLVEAADSNGSVTVFECFVPADSRMPAPHSHDAFEETIYGLEGVTSWTVDGRVVETASVTPSASPGAPSADSRTLALRTPSSCPRITSADYFREIHEMLAAGGGGPPDLAKLGEVMRRHGLTPAPPS